MIQIDPVQGLRMIGDGSVSLISTRKEGKTNVATVSWQTPLSQNPPLLGISLTPSCLTHEFVRESGEFVLSIPDASLVAETHYCGTHSGRGQDKVRLMELRTMRSTSVIPLQLTNCIGHLECQVRDWYPTGDHFFYTAQVITALVEQDYFENGWTDLAQTLHHLGGERYRAGGLTIEASRVPLPIQSIPKEPLFEDPKDRFLQEDK